MIKKFEAFTHKPSEEEIAKRLKRLINNEKIDHFTDTEKELYTAAGFEFKLIKDNVEVNDLLNKAKKQYFMFSNNSIEYGETEEFGIKLFLFRFCPKEDQYHYVKNQILYVIEDKIIKIRECLYGIDFEKDGIEFVNKLKKKLINKFLDEIYFDIHELKSSGELNKIKEIKKLDPYSEENWDDE